MALSRATAYSGENGDTTEGNHDTTINCGTVTNGDLLVVLQAGTKGGTVDTTTWDTPTKSSGTATMDAAVEIARGSLANDYTIEAAAWYIKITGSGTLVLAVGDGANNTFGFANTVLLYTGHDTTTPVVGGIADSEDGTTGVMSPNPATLGATPASADEVVAMINWDTDAGTGKAVTTGSGFTEIAEYGTSADYLLAQTAVKTGTTSTDVHWGIPDGGAPTRYSAGGVAFIVKAAAGGTTVRRYTLPTLGVG
jgi:hypothetical protein